MTNRVIALFVLMLALGSATGLQAQSRAAADSAWVARDHPRAEALYGELLAADSTDQRALHRMALLHAWSDRHAESLRLFQRLLAAAPDNTEAAIDRARVLAWSGDHAAAIAATNAVLAREPDNLEALAAHAQFAAWAGMFDASLRSYGALLAIAPDDRDALRGVARVTSWSGRLRQGEQRWLDVLAADPHDVDALVGLAAVQRWRGNDAEALATLQRAAALQPDNAEVATQMRWVRSTMAPRVTPTMSYEGDSDGNRMFTSALAFSYSPAPRVQLRADAYLRDLGYGPAPGLQERAHGVTLGLAAILPSRWSLAAAAGASGSDTDGAAIPAWRGSIATPRDGSFGLGAAVSHAAMDATAHLVRSRVRVTEGALDARFRGERGTSAGARISRARFQGSEQNHRSSGSVELFQRVARPLMLGIAVTALGFEQDLQDGYFDPNFFGVAMLPARFTRDLDRWNLQAEVAPGVQQVGSDGAVRGVARLEGRLAYRVAPGRDVALAGGYSSSGLTDFSTQGADYRYHSFSISGGWAF